MSNLNYTFMDENKKNNVNDINRIIFVSAMEDVRLSGLIRDETKKLNALVKEVEALSDSEADVAKAEELKKTIEATEQIIENYRALKRACLSGANRLLFGVHTKTENYDGLADDFGIAPLFVDFVDYRTSIISREAYIKKWDAVLKTFGMTAPDKLFRKSATKLADCVGDMSTNSKKVVKGELTTPTRMKGWLTVIMRTLTDDMRKAAGICRYDAETHTATVTYDKDGNAVAYEVADKD